MREVTPVHEKDAEKLKSAVSRLSLLGVLPSDQQLAQFYTKLVSLDQRRFLVSNFIDDPRHTTPGLKGFDMAIQAYLILSGLRQHEQLPVTPNEEGEETGRAFTLLISNEPDQKYFAEAQHRGFRLGLYAVGKASPQIDYIDSGILIGDQKIVAEHAVSGRALVGTHFDETHLPHFENGYYGVFPSNASHGFSFIVTDVNET